jgi:predicted glycoside hydrolase/deacetylase ChbG (UPF0249 family)
MEARLNRTLIVNADDFGWDDDTTDETIRLIDSGVVTSATIMTSRPATQRALDYARKHQDRVSFGLHFNIVDGHQLADTQANSLHDGDGLARPSGQQRIRALVGLLKARDIQTELAAQLKALSSAGISVSHVDSHGHLHKFPSVWKAMKPVIGEFGVRKVRRPQSIYSPTHGGFSRRLNRYCSRAFADALSTDNFAYLDSTLPNWLPGLVRDLPPGATELSIHPGTQEDWRSRETQALSTLRTICEEEGVRLGSFLRLGP